MRFAKEPVRKRVRYKIIGDYKFQIPPGAPAWPVAAQKELECDATGIGLFRSEFVFMNRRDLPDEDEQYEAYREVVEGMKGLPVTIRTLDIGADKTAEGAGDHDGRPVNPALGLS